MVNKKEKPEKTPDFNKLFRDNIIIIVIKSFCVFLFLLNRSTKCLMIVIRKLKKHCLYFA